MGVLTSEVGYTPAMPRREDHEVHKDMWRHWRRGEVQQSFSLNRAVCEIRCNNMVQQDRLQMTIQYGTCALHAGCLTLQTHTEIT